MIIRKIPDFDSDEARDEWYDRDCLRNCDRRRAFDALEEIDDLLTDHGLEVVVYTNHGDPYFEIVKREEEE